MEKNWVCIYNTTTVYLAEIAKDLLHEEEIDAVIINKKDSNYQFGILEIYVECNNAIKAKHILKDVNS
ncbi:MAG: DUF2007 domain-containing protein [Bacteroidales bacterium]|jgi:hypothetical protein|nr:DUF2007 domain-containing protein [Bacteroidales bacterium]